MIGKENKNFSILKSNAFYLEDITSSEVLETKLLKPFLMILNPNTTIIKINKESV